MRKLFILCAVFAAFAIAAPAFAGGDGPRGFCNGPGNDCNTVDESVTATGGNAAGGNSSVYAPDYSYHPTSSSSSSTGGSSSVYAPDYSYHPTSSSSSAGVDNTNRNFGVNKQAQGQVGIVAPDIETDVDTDIGSGIGNFSPSSKVERSGNSEVDVETDVDSRQSQFGINKQGQGQGQGQDQGQSQFGVNKSAQGQGQFGYVDSHDIYEAQERNPVSSAAPVSASACSSGVSAQGVDLGGAVAKVNPFCNLALTAETAAARGMTDVAEEMVGLMADMARAEAEGHFGIKSFLRGVPVLGGLLGFVW
jgi:hypothetical protein